MSNMSDEIFTNIEIKIGMNLTQCGLMMSYGDIDLGQ